MDSLMNRVCAICLLRLPAQTRWTTCASVAVMPLSRVPLTRSRASAARSSHPSACCCEKAATVSVASGRMRLRPPARRAANTAK